MASSKLMASSSTSSRNSDVRRNSLTQPEFYNFPNRQNSDEGFLRKTFGAPSEAQSAAPNILLRDCDATGATAPIESSSLKRRRTVDDVWREIVAGKAEEQLVEKKVECKAEAMDELMTLEDFLVKAGAVDESAPEPEPEPEPELEPELEPEPPAVAAVKVEVAPSEGLFGFDSSYVPRQGSVDSSLMSYGSNGGGSGSASGRGKRRASSLLEPMDRVAAQRQRRMIKNRESAARSRERKQQYQVELESMAVKLEEEKEQLLMEKAERMKERRKMLMEKVIPVVEKRRPARIFKRARSMEW